MPFGQSPKIAKPPETQRRLLQPLILPGGFNPRKGLPGGYDVSSKLRRKPRKILKPKDIAGGSVFPYEEQTLG